MRHDAFINDPAFDLAVIYSELRESGHITDDEYRAWPYLPIGEQKRLVLDRLSVSRPENERG